MSRPPSLPKSPSPAAVPGPASSSPILLQGVLNLPPSDPAQDPFIAAQDYSEQAAQKILSAASQMQQAEMTRQDTTSSSEAAGPDSSPTTQRQQARALHQSIKMEDDEPMMQIPQSSTRLARTAFKSGSQEDQQRDISGIQTLSPHDLHFQTQKTGQGSVQANSTGPVDQMTSTIEGRGQARSEVAPVVHPVQHQQADYPSGIQPAYVHPQTAWTSVAPTARYALPQYPQASQTSGQSQYEPHNLTRQEQQALLDEQFPHDSADPGLSYETAVSSRVHPFATNVQGSQHMQTYSQLPTRQYIDLSPYQEAHFPQSASYYLPVSASASSMASTSLATPATPFSSISGTSVISPQLMETALRKWQESETQVAVRKGQALKVFSAALLNYLNGYAMHPEPIVTQVFQHIIPLVHQELQKLDDHLRWIDSGTVEQTAAFARQVRQTMSTEAANVPRKATSTSALPNAGSASGSKRKQTSGRRVSTIVEARRTDQTASAVGGNVATGAASEKIKPFTETPAAKPSLDRSARSVGSTPRRLPPGHPDPIATSRSPSTSTSIAGQLTKAPDGSRSPALQRTTAQTSAAPRKDALSISQSDSVKSLPPPTTPKKRPKRAAAKQAETKIGQQQ